MNEDVRENQIQMNEDVQENQIQTSAPTPLVIQAAYLLVIIQQPQKWVLWPFIWWGSSWWVSVVGHVWKIYNNKDNVAWCWYHINKTKGELCIRWMETHTTYTLCRNGVLVSTSAELVSLNSPAQLFFPRCPRSRWPMRRQRGWRKEKKGGTSRDSV